MIERSGDAAVRPCIAAAASSLSRVACSAGAPPRAWGPLAHQAVTSEAIDTLPKGLKASTRRTGWRCPTLALDAHAPGGRGPSGASPSTACCPFPFADLPHTEAALKARFGDAAAKVGRLPWLIQESYARLVEAFKRGDKGKILTESDMLAGLVADLHNPLALTDNSDGQKTGQHGLWVRFSVQALRRPWTSSSSFGRPTRRASSTTRRGTSSR